jgi:predicted RNA-binding protein associated with RNAse of E/G family
VGWTEGTRIIRRDRLGGRTYWATAALVVEDTDAVISFLTMDGAGQYVADGLEHAARFAALQSGSWEMVEVPRFNHARWHHRWGDRWTLGQFWTAAWEPMFFYVNFDEPYVRTADGVVTRDLQLDIWVAPDLSSWRWKDEDHLADFVAADLITDEVAAAISADGEAIIDALTAGRDPFDVASWDWRPDPSWAPSALSLAEVLTEP